MKERVLTIPKKSPSIIVLCIALQLSCSYWLATQWNLTIAYALLAIILATFIADLVTGLFHFGFDYVWPDNFPIMGPISVEFRAHHDAPALDPSDWVSNLTRGAYMGIAFALISLFSIYLNDGTKAATLSCLIAVVVSLWGLFFHQIHSYSHMGKTVLSQEFNEAVARASMLDGKARTVELRRLFDNTGIPPFIRFLQKTRIILQPEVHWQHHVNFESHFSSLNGWSDPFTNVVFGPLARRAKRAKLHQQKV